MSKKKLGGHIMSGMKFEKEIFMKYLIEREASEATKKKYMTDVKKWEYLLTV